jgi:hypothetical protein
MCFGYTNQSASLPEVGQDIQPRPVRWLMVRVPRDSGIEIHLGEPGPPVHHPFGNANRILQPAKVAQEATS